MKSTVASLLFLMVTLPLCAQETLSPPPLPRATLVAIGGNRTFAVPINGQAVGFAIGRPQQQVAIMARLGNGGGHAYVDAFLTTKIGPGTTEADEIAHITLDLHYPYDEWVTLFSDLDLDKGVYWLTVAKPKERAHSSINWFVANPRELHTACGMGYFGTKSFTFFGDAAEYLPASKFENKFESTYGFQFEVTGAWTPELDTCGGVTYFRQARE